MKRFVDIDTPLAPDTLLFHTMRGREELGRLSEFELELLSTDRGINLDDVLGKTIDVQLKLENEEVRHFSGYVTRIALDGMHGRYYRYRAIARPWLWFLTRTTNCRIFQDKSVPDILKDVFATHSGVADVKFQLTETYTPWEYCVQYRETDFNFVSRLMEHEGIYYYFKHSKGRHTLVIADSYSAHTVAPGADEVPFIQADELVREDRGHVSDWSITHELQPGKYALTDYDFEKPSVNLQVKSKFKREHAMAEYELFDYPGDYIERGDGELYARTRIEEVQAKFERVQGETNALGLATGYLFTLASHPRDDQNAEYLVVSAEYELKSTEYESSEAMGADYHCRFTALNSHQPFRAERTTPKPVVQGPQTALTVGPGGETIHTDKFGRVKVQFHWDRYGKRDDKSSCWIRVSQNWGGKGWGGMFIPHVGQEVIVQFLEGDPDMPLITGRVYNAENMPPVALPAGKTQSIIRDHGGNEIKMEGNDGGQQIKLFSPHGNTVLAIGAPGSPGQGIEGLTDLFFKMTVGEDWREVVQGSKFEEVWGNNKKLVRGDTTTMIWGHKAEDIKGFETKTVLGNSRAQIIGGKEEMILGGSASVIVGGKGEYLLPFGFKMHTGYQLNHSPRTVELNKSIKAENDGKLLKKIQDEATKISGTQILDVTKRIEKLDDSVEFVKGVMKEKIEELNQVIGQLEAKIARSFKLEAGTVEIHSKGDMKITAPWTNVDGNQKVSKNLKVEGDVHCGSVFEVNA